MKYGEFLFCTLKVLIFVTTCSFTEFLLKLWAIDYKDLKLIDNGTLDGHTKEVNACAWST